MRVIVSLVSILDSTITLPTGNVETNSWDMIRSESKLSHEDQSKNTKSKHISKELVLEKCRASLRNEFLMCEKHIWWSWGPWHNPNFNPSDRSSMVCFTSTVVFWAPCSVQILMIDMLHTWRLCHCQVRATANWILCEKCRRSSGNLYIRFITKWHAVVVKRLPSH